VRDFYRPNIVGLSDPYLRNTGKKLMRNTQLYYLDDKLKMLEHLHTGIRPVSVDVSTYDPEDVTMKLIDILYAMKGYDIPSFDKSTPTRQLSEGYEYGGEEAKEKKPKFDLSFCKGRK